MTKCTNCGKELKWYNTSRPMGSSKPFCAGLKCWKEYEEKKKAGLIKDEEKKIKKDLKQLKEIIPKSDEVKKIDKKSTEIKMQLILLPLPTGIFLSWLFWSLYPSYSLITGVWTGVVIMIVIRTNELYRLKKEKNKELIKNGKK